MKPYYAFAVVAALARTSSAASIALFADPEYSSCNLNIPAPPAIGTLYIVAADCADIPGYCPAFTGAEFRVVGLPAGWFVFSTPSPQASVAIGDPFGAGANIAFGDYLLSDRVLLYTCTVWPAAPGAQATLQVTAHSAPAHPIYVCPLAIVGDCPADPRACVGGGTLFVNQPRSCTVAVRDATWSMVKRLYDR